MYRVNAGAQPSDSWILDKAISGGRIVGEACHFVDLMTFLNGSLPTKVQAFNLPDAVGQETTSINLMFENGSVGTIAYFANGPSSLPKEYLEVYRAGTTAILRDFKKAEIFGSQKTSKKKLSFQDKGQAAMVSAFLSAVRKGDPSPIPFEETVAVTSATFKAVESVRTGSVMLV
jgi:predicted dehydrogenase